MAEFIRQDIIDAYAFYESGYGDEEIRERLLRMGEELRGEDFIVCDLSSNAQRIYSDLMIARQRDRCGYNPCGCATCMETAIGAPEVALCYECEMNGCAPTCGSCADCAGQSCEVPRDEAGE